MEVRMQWQSIAAAAAGVVLSVQLCEAQVDGQGYLVAGAGAYSNQFASGRVNQLAVGGEALTARNIGIGGEIGFGDGGGDAWFALSLNATRHIQQKSGGRAAPFLTAGYTRLITLTERGGRHAVNVGLGTRYWVNRRSSLLLEIRDLLFQGVGATQVWSVRTGVGWK
jgi:hypothetical protein